MTKITISKIIKASVEQVYKSYLDPIDNQRWNTAGFGWSTGFVNIDPKVGGKWESEFKSPDGQNDFIFGGAFTEIIENQKIVYIMPNDQGDSTKDRHAEVFFEEIEPETTKVTIIFDAETENSIERQESGWNSILDNFAKFVEIKSNPNNQTIDKFIQIQASPEKIWTTLIGPESYKVWASPFAAGNYFEGEMKYDSKIHFMSGEAGNNSGLVSLIRVFIPNFQISFEHLGYIKDGVEDLNYPEFQTWKGLRETYTLNPKGDITELNIFQDLTKKEAAFFDTKWDQALSQIKKLSEEAI